MSSANPPPFADDEFEFELTEDVDLGPAEQRQGMRQETSASLLGTVAYRDKTLAVRISDLSPTGAGISAETRLPLNEECMLTLHMSVCGSDYALEMKCRVRYCEAENHRTYQSGLQFIDMTQGTRDTLMLLIR